MPKTPMPNEGQFQVLEASEPTAVSTPHGSFLSKLAPKKLREVRDTFKNEGLKGAIRRYGWKLFAGFFIYYLIRDSIIYLLLPYLIAKGLM